MKTVESKLSKPTPEYLPFELFNFREERMARPAAAEYLGVSIEFLETNVCSKRHAIPYIKIGSKVYYLKSDLDAWVLSRKVEV
jgi:hypothetical protein